MIVVSARYNFDRTSGSLLEQGTTFNRQFTWIDRETNTGIDLSNYSSQMQVRKTSNDTVILELSTANGRMSLSAAGEINMTVAAADTENLQPGTYLYDLEIEDNATGDRHRLIEGSFVISEQITK